MHNDLTGHPISKIIRDNNCTFCRGMDDKSITPNFRMLFPNLVPRVQIVAENEYWYVIPDDSPITEHHLLLVSKNHAYSWASLDDKSAGSLVSIRNRMSDYLLRKYPQNDVFFFEHGSGVMEDGRPIHCGACGSHVHTHIHVIPLEKRKISDLVNYVSARISKTLNMQPTDLDLDQIPEKSNDPYLYVASNTSKAFLFPTNIENACLTVPSQYIRSLIGDYLGLSPSEWDYRVMFEQNRELAKQRIQATIALFRDFQIVN